MLPRQSCSRAHVVLLLPDQLMIPVAHVSTFRKWPSQLDCKWVGPSGSQVSFTVPFHLDQCFNFNLTKDFALAKPPETIMQSRPSLPRMLIS